MRGFDMVSNWATPETVHSSGVQVSKREQSLPHLLVAVQVRQDLGREARTGVISKEVRISRARATSRPPRG